MKNELQVIGQSDRICSHSTGHPFTYDYNCVGDHSFYAGAALLISCTIPAFFIKKGAWLQHRASTLALCMIFTMAVPTFVSSSQFAVETSRSATALFLVALIALISNVAVFGYQIYTIINRRKNPLKDELYNHHSQFQEVHIANLDVPSSFEAHESHHPVA